MTKLLYMDVDGTLTDGTIYIGLEGEVFKAFNSRDGYGISCILPKYKCIPVIITARVSIAVTVRCSELGIVEIHQGCSNKKEQMLKVAKKYGIFMNEKGKLPNTAYIGDDFPDLPGMEIAEITGCPSDATKTICKYSDFVSEYNGGHGAVRDFIDWLFLR